MKGNTYFNLILFAGGALAVDDKIICLQELCGRDPTFLPLQVKALGGNPSYICAPRLLCLYSCLCLCCTLCFVFTHNMCSSPYLSLLLFLSLLLPLFCIFQSYVLLTFFVFCLFLYLPMCSSTQFKEQQAGEDFKRILDSEWF